MSVRIEVVDESGKVDLHAADVDLLARLFTVVGVDQATAGDIAAAIADWRDADDLTQPQGGAEDPAYASAGLAWGAKDAQFDTVAEVEQVLGMTPAIYARVAPLLRSEEHTSELQSLMRNSYAVFCLKKKK